MICLTSKKLGQKIVTYLQYDSPLGFCIHVPPCLHGDGAHDINPEKIKKIIKKGILLFLTV